MTEAEWLVCDDPMPMLEFVQTLVSDRKLRLFSVACCRRVEWVVTEPWSTELRTDLVGHFQKQANFRQVQADQATDDAELRAMIERARFVAMDAGHGIAHPGELGLYAVSCTANAFEAILDPVRVVANTADARAYKVLEQKGSDRAAAVVAARQANPRHPGFDWAAEEAAIAAEPAFLTARAVEQWAQAALLRCIVGNPFRPTAIESAWRTANVVSLAQAIYADRAFDRLPILADALEDAGCTDAAILDHCRQPGEHVHGCWVVDLVLERS